MTSTFRSYVAIGDSFSEGVGDELADGRVRGWADFVAAGIAAASGESVDYANLAIRGRLLRPIVGQQLDAALALKPELLSINGGGNDILRPRVSISGVADLMHAAVERAATVADRVLFVSGANPTRHLPLGASIEKRGNILADAVVGRFDAPNVTYVDNWNDRELAEARYWSRDKLHLNALGHARVASNVLAALGLPPVDGVIEVREMPKQGTAAYYRQYVLPWIGRRLTGRSSGDNREPKFASYSSVEPPG